jgi:hypothetical protein
VTGIWALPGPGRFAAAAGARLEEGCSVLIGLPGPLLADAGFCAGLSASLAAAADCPLEAVEDPGDGAPPAAVIAAHVGADDIEPGRAAAAALAGHPKVLGRVLLLRADSGARCGRLAEFARTFVLASRSVPAPDRPRLVVLSDSAAAAELAGCDPLLHDLWWWGVLDRLDTALHVRGQLPDRGEELVRDAITEVAGFDLELADHLAAGWDGSAGALPALLACYPAPGHSGPLPALPHSSTPWAAPPAALLPLWDAGLVDRWDAFPAYWHACALPAGPEARSRIWRAQVRALMPAIDEERARIETWLRREIRGLPADTVLEPGDLYSLLQEYPRLKSWRGGHRKRLVYWLRETRNRLAHLGTLTPDEIAQGRRLIAADRRAD